MTAVKPPPGEYAPPMSVEEIRLNRKLKKAQKALHDIYVHVHGVLPVEQENMGNRLQVISSLAYMALDGKVPKLEQGSYAGPKLTILDELARLKAKKETGA